METKKNKNVLRGLYAGSRSLDYVVEHYNNLLKQKEELTQRKITFEEVAEEKDKNSIRTLKFREKKYIYNLISHMYSEEKDNDKLWELGFIKEHLRDTFEDLDEYYNIIEKLEKVYEGLSDIDKYINLDNFKNENSHKTCKEKHTLVRLEEELVCMRCGETTKNYDLTDEELEFLTFCAEKQGMLIGRIQESLIPFIKVLIEEQEEYKAKRKPLSEFSPEERSDWAEEYYLTDSAEICDIQEEIKKAKALDSGNFYTDEIKLINPAYLSGSKMNEFYKEIERTIEEIKNSDSKYKDLLLEQCQVAIYELYILNGYRIPVLFQSKDLEHKIAVAKAYYNLSNSNFRVESGYFEPTSRNFDALSYPCRTADPEINQMILDLKLKR